MVLGLKGMHSNLRACGQQRQRHRLSYHVNWLPAAGIRLTIRCGTCMFTLLCDAPHNHQHIHPQVPDSYPHWLANNNKDAYHSDKLLGQMYDRVLEHPINKQLLQTELQQQNDPQRSIQQQGAKEVAAAWLQRLQASGFPLLCDVLVLLPRVSDVWDEFESDVLSLMNHWHVHDVGECVILGVCGALGCQCRVQPRSTTFYSVERVGHVPLLAANSRRPLGCCCWQRAACCSPSFSHLNNILTSPFLLPYHPAIAAPQSLNSAGQLLTSCLPRLQSASSQRHQHSEQRDQLNRELRAVWAKARKACLWLLLETVARPMLLSDPLKSSSSTAASLCFDYSRFQEGVDDGGLYFSNTPLKEMEGLLYQHRDEPGFAAASAAVAIACLLTANNLQQHVISKREQSVQQLLQQQGAAEALEAVTAFFGTSAAAAAAPAAPAGDGDDDGDDSDSSNGEEEDDAAAVDSLSVDEAGVPNNLSPADLLRLAPVKADEVELLTQLSFQFVMGKELAALARQL